MVYERLIVLDDDEYYLSLLSGFSDIIGIEFKGCNSYQHLELDGLTESDLLLLDLYMPDRDALDIIFDIAQSGRQVHISVMSGADDDILSSIVAAARKLDVRFVGVLRKPVPLGDLSSMLNRPSCHFADNDNDKTSLEKVSVNEFFNLYSLEQWFSNKFVYPVFQPQFDLSGELIRGVECLTRVKHPSLKDVSPFDFISAIEVLDKIDAYSLLLIESALTQIEPLLREDRALCCSFNISAQTLNKVFADDLVSLFKRFDVAPEQLVLEITESNAVSMTVEGLYAISRLKVFGLKLAIDDFGTGYSSIRQLVDLPFDEIKIDKSFTLELEENNKARAIVGATFDLAASLGFKLVVEGVETREQLNFLRDKGNCAVQGYLFSKPLEAPQLEALILCRGMA